MLKCLLKCSMDGIYLLKCSVDDIPSEPVIQYYAILPARISSTREVYFFFYHRGKVFYALKFPRIKLNTFLFMFIGVHIFQNIVINNSK